MKIQLESTVSVRVEGDLDDDFDAITHTLEPYVAVDSIVQTPGLVLATWKSPIDAGDALAALILSGAVSINDIKYDLSHLDPQKGS